MKDPTNSKELKKVLDRLNGPYSASSVRQIGALKARLINQNRADLRPLCEVYVSRLIARKRDRWGKNARR
jgi:hypothetical protein